MPGRSRQRLVRTLNASYSEGLLSEHTFADRLHLLLASPIVDPGRLVGDLTRRVPRPGRLRAVMRTLASTLGLHDRDREPPRLLALDWTGSAAELLIGRAVDCDVLVPTPTVSRLHARLVFRDGGWTIQDLNSTNGTLVNGVEVGRCRLRPGDRLLVADQLLLVD